MSLFKFPELPQVQFPVNETGKALPALKGREIITRSANLGNQEAPQKGYHQRYSHTLSELTVLMEQLQRENKRELQEMRRIRNELRFYWEIPAKVNGFIEDTAEQMVKYRNEQSAMLEHVSQVLDDLLEGKAKPSGDMMTLILDAIEGQKTRLETLENKVTTLFTAPAHGNGKTSASQ